MHSLWLDHGPDGIERSLETGQLTLRYASLDIRGHRRHSHCRVPRIARGLQRQDHLRLGQSAIGVPPPHCRKSVWNVPHQRPATPHCDCAGEHADCAGHVVGRSRWHGRICLAHIVWVGLSPPKAPAR